jgi:hypothetical protein
MKLGKSPYLKTAPVAIRAVKQKANELQGAYSCPASVLPASSCRRIKFPVAELAKIHNGIFKKASPVKKQMFESLKKSYNKRYQQFLLGSFPDEIVICPK